MAASHFKGHPQGDKPSETKKTNPKTEVIYNLLRFRQLFTKMVEHFAPAGGPKPKKHVKEND